MSARDTTAGQAPPTFKPGQKLSQGITLVEASAGTGKTYNITPLVLRLVAERNIGIDKIRAFAHHHFRAMREQRAVAEVLQVELRLSKKFIEDYKPDKLFAYLGVLMELVREGQASGVIREDVDPFTIGWAFFGALEEIGLSYVIALKRDRTFDLDAAADQVAELFVRGIAA